ncbi:MAG TPA: porin [Parvibaculum sp.]|uniref:OprO/OprP family phosphate-selective porin n=1 Tax=Parvibaculum sp. TaxID=2024848 RepID=UPI002C4FCAFD|nr:porin [Parvibaculum sp.]HMM15706.1 porin [Parvibaculum sp.]
MHSLKTGLAALMTGAALTFAASAPAFAAGDVEARIQALENELKALKAEVAARDAKIDAMEKKTADLDTMPKFKPNKLEMESRDGQFSIGIGGQLQADAYLIDDDGGKVVPMGNGAEIRRARMNVYGKVFGDWRYKLEADFAPAGYSYGNTSVSITDAYVEHDLAKNLLVRVGNQYEPFGLSAQTSDRYNTFMEYALPTVLWPSRQLGALIAYGDGESFGISGGLFTRGIQSGGIQNGSNAGNWALTGRGFYAPINTDKTVLHLALNGSYRGIESGSSTFNSFPEAHGANYTLAAKATNVQHELRYGPELALVYGPLSLQGEWTFARMQRNSGADADINGGYLEASWFVTGEQRNYNVKSGLFDRPKATNALQLAMRYSRLDLSDANLAASPINLDTKAVPTTLADARGTGTNYTLGANYYFNPNVRLMLNYVIAKDDYVAASGNPDQTYRVLQSRLQLDW